MKGAFLLSASDQLFDNARDVLVSLGAVYYEEDGAVQLRDELDGLFTLFDNAEPQYEYRDGPLAPAPGLERLPDVESMTGLAVECRNEKNFAMIVRKIDQSITGDVWVLDGDGIVWPASAVDPARVWL
jgi:hypothetical protein